MAQIEEDDLLNQEIQKLSEVDAIHSVKSYDENEPIIKETQAKKNQNKTKQPSAKKTDKSGNKSKGGDSGCSMSGCLFIIIVLITAIVLLFRYCDRETGIDNDNSQDTTIAESASEDTPESLADKSIDLPALEARVFDWIKNHEKNDVINLSLSRTNTPLHFEGTITWNRYGKTFTDLLIVQYFLESGGITWHVEESQEELDYIAAHMKPIPFSQVEFKGELYGEKVHLFINSASNEIQGYYYFDKEGAQSSKRLYGNYDSSSSYLKLLETNDDDAIICIFEGQFDGKTYRGSFSDITSSETCNFNFYNKN